MVVQAWNPSIERAGEECQPETRRETVSETKTKQGLGTRIRIKIPCLACARAWD